MLEETKKLYREFDIKSEFSEELHRKYTRMQTEDMEEFEVDNGDPEVYAAECTGSYLGR